MKIDAMKKARRVAAAAALAMALPVLADDEPPDLKLPEDMKVAAAPGESAGDKRGLQYFEQRIGGRLERVTVTRDNGFTETYRNHRADAIWSAPENEIGETANMRQWIIRAW